MARKKVKLVRIQNDSARRATLKKRRKGLIKKARELSVLCDVRACLIVYGPYDQVPEIWPPERDEVMMVLNEFRSMPEMEQTKKMLNQEGFIQHRIDKVVDQLKKIQSDNYHSEITSLLYQCTGGRRVDDLTVDVLHRMRLLLDMKLKVVQERIEVLQGSTSVDPGGRVAKMEDVMATEIGNFNVALEILRKQENNYINYNHQANNMFMFGPPCYFPADDVAFQSYIDNGAHLPAFYPDNNNQSLLDHYYYYYN